MRSRFLPATLVLLLAIFLASVSAVITVRIYSNGSDQQGGGISYAIPSAENTNIYGSSTHNPDDPPSGDNTYDPPEYCGDGSCNNGEECDTCPHDCGQCEPQDYCGDGNCKGDETCNNCPNDCGQCEPPKYCGDGSCNNNEECDTCPQDCGQCKPEYYCGDGFCSSTENCDTCKKDCGECPIDEYCGDSICSSYENCDTCSKDCGECATEYYCGDGYCKSNESCYTCSEDCGSCETEYYCGDGYCKSNESCNTCPDDCGKCEEYKDEEDHIGGLNYEVDRLANVDDTTLSCIKKRLNEEEYKILRYGVPTTIEQKEDLRDLQEKAAICFATYQEIKNIEEATKHFGEMNIVADECIVKKIGEKAYKEISSGEREPTELERRLSKECLINEDMPEVQFQTSEQKLSDDIESCLILALGEDGFNEVKDGVSRLDLEDRDKVQRCFGASPEPFKELPTFKLPPEVESCLETNIWKERRELIKLGKAEPSEIEREFAKECFDELNEIQLEVLPTPPDLVPYLEVRPETVKIESIAQRTETVDEELKDRKLVLSGEGPSLSLVDIYLFSDPIVVTTKTDENGNWVYELNHPLDEGNHVAYVTVKDDTDSIVRSAVFDFQVLAADQQVNQPFLEENQAQETSYQFLNRVVLITGLGVLIVSAGIGLFYKMRIDIKKDEALMGMIDKEEKNEEDLS